MGERLGVEAQQPAAGGTRGDRAERPGQVPAAIVMGGCPLAGPHAGFETAHIGADQFAPGDAGTLALAQREQRGEQRRTGMQDDAAHMRVVEIEDMAHLAIGQRRVEQA